MIKSRKDKKDKLKSSRGRKLAVQLVLVLLAFVLLSYRLYLINRDNGDAYKRQVLAQQIASSRVLPSRRGEIQDRKGSKLAYSEKVYSLVVDAKLMNGDDGRHLRPTLDALKSCFPNLNVDAVKEYVNRNPASRYKVFMKRLTYDEISPFEKIMAEGLSSNKAPVRNSDSEEEEEEEELTVAGVWFEDDYMRRYPYGSLGCDVLGFVQGNYEGQFGLEEFYNSTLNGTNGRRYGYMNDDSIIEESIRPAEDGLTLVTSLDTNIQSIAEKHIKQFYDEYTDNYREGPAANNIGVVIMNPNNGEIYGMASYPVFDLNDPTNMDQVDMRPYLPEGYSASGNEASPPTPPVEPPPMAAVSGNVSGDSVSEAKAPMDPKVKAMNQVWRNFCISDSYEPGSVMKPFTVAAALDTAKITGDESYQCNGYLEVGGFQIHCHNRLGDGLLTVEQGVAKSCNVVLMDIAFAMGIDEWRRYNKVFNFGLKTNVDLAGETSAGGLGFGEGMTQTDLAVASFGQGFNVTMIQMAAGFSALVNGGYYYQPHLVTKFLNSEGGVVEENNPRVLKQVISNKASERMRDYLRAVVMSPPSDCTGWSARPAGYTEGGKTGTAEKAPRSKRDYLISFMGYVPAEDPKVLCYVVIDRPNVEYQSESTRLATVLNKKIMTEVLPYLNVFPTEPITEKEREELEAQQMEFAYSANGVSLNSIIEQNNSEAEGEAAEGEEGALDGEETPIVVEPEIQRDSAGNVISNNAIRYDSATGYPLDPATGQVLNPVTLLPLDGDDSIMTEAGQGSHAEFQESEEADDSIIIVDPI